jgi:heme exporter protein D
MSTFFAMNGYGYYIWTAYGVTAIALLVEVVALRSRGKATLAEARLMEPDDSTRPLGAAK